ncbi:MAG: DUF1801 domain-containing protein [Paracoccaceae bacterium]
MTTPRTIEAYHAALAETERPICDALRSALDDGLPGAESRLWHGHPVWFLEGNPIAGYDRLKTGVRLLFWSGQSFEAPGLVAEGRFKAAGMRYGTLADLDTDALRRWLEEARVVQWDYKNIVRRKGRLEPLF